MKTIFVTGFPGFLASNLVPRILTKDPNTKVVCVVQSDFLSTAQERLKSFTADIASRVSLVAGDITQPGLGLSEPIDCQSIYHLAAVYDLNIPRQIGFRVNVEGTRHVVTWAKQLPNLEMFHYVSTCYVSGRYCGPFRESDLTKGQKFNNYYEETKYLAEVEVQHSSLPWAIYRPAIVVGNSKTGATLKYDGPYPVVSWLLRQPKFAALMPSIGDPSRYRINLVPQDYVLDALNYLSTEVKVPGRIYQLSDPNPLTVEDLITELGRCTGRRLLRFSIPLEPSRAALKYLPKLSNWCGFTPAMLDYFVHPTHYLCDATTSALEGSGIACPSIQDVLPNLVDYLRSHRKPVG